MDTIFAQCSGHGKSGVVVFRISGPASFKALEELMMSNISKLEPRKLYLKKIYNPINKNQIDDAMVVFFKGKSSFTGEDSVEIHAHGSIAVIKLLNEALISLKYVRLAEAGEFARRSFLNGKMDLTSAEGLADLIDSETHLQHKQAIKQLGGGLEKIYDNWRVQLLNLISLIEAYIDFPDEGIPEEIINESMSLIDKLVLEIKDHLNDDNRGEILRNGIKMVILGKPNVGKSSLLNYLMKRELAITSEIAGTTRDVIEGHLDIGGYPVILQDTAGIRNDSDDIIEQEGIKRAKKIASQADIKIIIYDALEENVDDYFTGMIDDNSIILINKVDLLKSTSPRSELHKENEEKIILTSIKDNLGLDQLTSKIKIIAEKIAKPSDLPQITRQRHRVQLKNALECLSACDINGDLVLLAEDIRMTIRSLSNITGKITVDEILGEIFSSFCIGK